MNKRKIRNIIILILIIIIAIFSYKNFIKSQKLNSLDYNVQLKENGEAVIVETWNITASQTNTLFKTFKYDPNKFKNISVVDVTNNIEYKQIYNLQYHVDPECFYALKNNDGLFEIAWNIGADKFYKNRTYKITYTVEDAVRLYNDCAEFYWQFLADTSAIPAKKVTGKIRLPNNVDNIDEDFKVWAHGPLSGEIYKTSNNLAEFKVPKISAFTMLETRVTTAPELFSQIKNKINLNKLESILQEETAWANDANQKRTTYQEQLNNIKKIANIVIAVVAIILLGLFFYINKVILDNPKIEPSQKFNYYREIPNKKFTPADVEFIYKLGKKFDTGKVISAILLDLGFKKIIGFEPMSKEKDDVKVYIYGDSSADIEKEEKDVLAYIRRAASGVNILMLKRFKQYGKMNKTASYNLWISILRTAKKRNIENGKFDLNKANKKKNFIGFNIAFSIIILLSIIFYHISSATALLIVMAGINIVFSSIAITRLHGFSQEAIDEQEKLKGLKHFIEDFSLLDEKSIPDLDMWDEYLVYATIFGISEKVIENLKIKFPQLNDEKYFKNNYPLLYCDRQYNMGRSFQNSIYSGFSSYKQESSFMTYLSGKDTFSSGSGGGGGFSSGGGGRIWWRKHGWKIKNKEKKRFNENR